MSRFLASREASCLKNVVVSGLAPPDVVNKSGVMEARSSSWISSSYFHIWLAQYIAGGPGGGGCSVGGCIWVKILTLKRVFSAWLPQNPLAWRCQGVLHC